MDAQERLPIDPKRPHSGSDAPRLADQRAISSASEALCFPHKLPRAPFAERLTPLRLNNIGLMRGVSELSDVDRAAFGRLLPVLLCGEESAFHVFSREALRISDSQFSRTQALAYRIAAEELQHERLLQELRSHCPVSDDIASSSSRSRHFFMRMASRDPAVHFATVAALDSAVCIILSALVRPLLRSNAVVEILERIRSDEARHVRFSRHHAYELGASRSLLMSKALAVRSEVAALLYPFGSAFEDLGVDMDHLLRRVNAHPCQ
jgi:hypothetical protein